MFGRRSIVQNVAVNSNWFADGAISVASPLFHPVFVVPAEKYYVMHSLFYFLLPNKTEETDTRMWRMIRDLEHILDPQMIHCDFELAIMNSVRSVYPNSTAAGCFFHLLLVSEHK